MCVPSTDPRPLVVEVEDSDLGLLTHSLCDEKFRTVLVGQKEDQLPLIQAGNQETDLHHEIVEEIFALGRIAVPSTITGLLNYARNLVSMLFLGHLGHVELAAGALSVGFANITGYSIISGLAMGMEPICGQAFGAQKQTLLTLTLHRTIAFLLLISVPITFLWLHVDKILLLLNQDPKITSLAKTYLLYALPDLFLQCILNPFRIYLRSQNITNPIALCSFVASLVHIIVNHYLVNVLKSGIKGVAMGVVVANLSLTMLLLCYAHSSEACKKAWTSTLSFGCFIREWGTIIRLAIPSCISVCLEWWWYELMIILCGLLSGPQETVSAIGVLMQMTALVYVFPSSLSYGVSTRVAQELGAGRPERARKASMIGAVFGAWLGTVAMAFNLWARAWWGPMFTDRGQILKLVSNALPIIGLCELGNCPQTAMCGALRGSARANVGAHVNLGGFYGVGLPAALLFGFWMGLGFVGLWMGLLAAQASCTAVLVAVLARTDWAAEAARAEELTSGKQVVRLDETIDGKGGKEKLKGELLA